LEPPSTRSVSPVIQRAPGAGATDFRDEPPLLKQFLARVDELAASIVSSGNGRHANNR
jgi:hypothetical protein